MVIRGTDKGETLTGGPDADTIYGLGGDDVLVGGGGADSLYGGDGNDRLVASAQGYAGGGAGNDTLDLTAARDLSAGGDAGDDLAILSGTRAAYTVIDDGRGRFRLYGADARLYLDGIERFRFADVTLTAADLVPGATIIGTDANDVIRPGAVPAGEPAPTAFGDIIDGGLGDDWIDGGAGADTMTGGYGADTFVVDDAGDTVTDAEAEDRVLAGVSVAGIAAGRIELTGAANVDAVAARAGATIVGNAGDNRLTGTDAGNETIEGGAGNDTMDGGLGFDTVSYASATAGIVLQLGRTTAQATGGAGTDTIRGFEAVTGSEFADKLTGSAADEWFEGGAGDDTLSGGAGRDTVSYAGAAMGVRVNLSVTTVQDTVGAGRDKLSGFENVAGSRFADVFAGSSGANQLDGGAGDDVLYGAAGRDVLVGGEGADTFLFKAAGDSRASDPDFLQDFSAAQGDRIDLRQIDADTTRSGNQAFRIVGALSGRAGELAVRFDGTFTRIEGDLNGDGQADFALLAYAATVPPEGILL